MRPESGGRVELRLTRDDDTTANYEIAIYAPSGEWSATAQASSAGAVRIEAWSSSPPPWLESFALVLLRSALRSHQAESAWPRRITRWRPGPEEPS